MNLFYEDYPCSILAAGEEVPIVTDFRDYVRLIDMLKSNDLSPADRQYFLALYFEKQPKDMAEALEALADFIALKPLKESQDRKKDTDYSEEPVEIPQKAVYSFAIDYAFIFSGFLQIYGINIRTIPYMHWWEFRLLFEGLPEDTEIKKRIMYRGIDPGAIKDKKERERIIRIQNAIRLPDDVMTDYDIGDAFV